MKIRDAIYLLLDRFKPKYTDTNVSGVAIVKRAGVCTLTCFANLPSTADGGLIFTIPEGFRPIVSMDYQISGTNGSDAVGTIRFKPDGNATAVFGTFNPGNRATRFTFTYISGGYKPTRFNAFGTLKGVAICG